MKAEHYITISSRRTIERRCLFRVALKYFDGDLNTLDHTIVDRMFLTQKAAENYAKKLARQYNDARILNGCTSEQTAPAKEKTA